MPESLSDRYAELLSGSYDCADRIVLNAYFRMGHTAGGFRVWWGTLTGSEETLDNAHLNACGHFIHDRLERNIRDWKIRSSEHKATKKR